MDKNTVIGFILIFAILLIWNLTMGPDVKKQMEERQQLQDSVEQVQQPQNSSEQRDVPIQTGDPEQIPVDSQQQVQQQTLLALQYGAFAPSATGKEEEVVLENERMQITLTSKGGRIKEVLLKEHYKIELDSNHKEHKVPLKLMEDDKNRFEYLLPVKGASIGKISTQDLYFTTEKTGNSVTFRAPAGPGKYFEQKFSINDDAYTMDYSIRFVGLEDVLNTPDGSVELNWKEYLDRLELNYTYEHNYSTVYYKPVDDDYDYCNCMQEDKDELPSEQIEWLSHSNQFFASILMTKDRPFKGGVFETIIFPSEERKENSDLKIVHAIVEVPVSDGAFAMEMYTGPKDFEVLSEYGNELEYIVPFGRSIIGTANRWIIRPMFNFLSTFLGAKGIVILVLTLIVKIALYPFMYKMLYSQAKMAALKPRLSTIREKHKDDQSQAQMESMKLYREFGVNPLGGCLPVVLQMPVWLALYRFFPASIEFRQEGFLWATDLSSYDAAFWLPYELPFYGQHVSLFTLLWAVTTLMYTYYNMQQMDMANMGGANAKMMKYMQFLMPLFFLFFFNNFASGLTCYLVFSNLLNIAQTLITKNVIIDHDKIKEELEAYRKKPKKKSGFQARLESAMEQQKAIAAQRQEAQKGKKKK